MDEKTFVTKNVASEADVISFYNEYADSWDERFGDSPGTKTFLEERWLSFERALSNVNNHQFAVELGVGTGQYIGHVASKFDRVCAVDGAPSMINLLDQKLKSIDCKNVDTHVANVCNLDFIEDNTADLVYFFGLIEHIIDMDEFLAEIKRILKPGGVVIGVTPNARSPWYLIRGIVRGTSKHCSSDTYYSASDVKMLLENAGFSDLSTDCWGAVPAGVSGIVFHVLKFAGKLIEMTPLRAFLGGVTFSARTHN